MLNKPSISVLFRVIIFFSVFLVGFSQAYAQKPSKMVKEPKLVGDKYYTLQKNIYRNAVEVEDYETAVMALQTIMAYQPADSIAKLECVRLYFDNLYNYNSAYSLSKKLLEKDRNNIFLIEYYARSAEQLGKYAEAHHNYEKMYYLTDSLIFGYLTTVNLYNAGKFNDASIMLQTMLSKKGISDYTIEIAFGQDKVQQVPILAAFYNIKALILIEQTNTEAAKLAFQEALKIFPDFELAKINLRKFGAQ